MSDEVLEIIEFMRGSAIEVGYDELTVHCLCDELHTFISNNEVPG